jgi:hypothetical protein
VQAGIAPRSQPAGLGDRDQMLIKLPAVIASSG